MNKRILIVEDNIPTLEVMTMMIEMDGYEVKGLSNAKNLLTEARNWKPDLLVLDIDLGGFDGRELCHYIKHERGLSHLPIIITSAANATKLNSALDYGADAVLPKPFDIQKLSHLLHHHIRLIPADRQ